MNIKEEYLLIRYAEIALKGRNRVDFEKQLIKNIKDCFKKNNHEIFEINRFRGRIVIKANYFPELKNVFGISSVSPSIKEKINIEDIQTAMDYFIQKKDNNDSFRVSVQRITKDTKLNSMELERELGAYIYSKTNAKVSLKEYINNYSVEIINGSSYVFSEIYKGYGGLPVGTQGQVFLIAEDDSTDIILAGVLLLKRGCLVHTISFENKKFNSKLLKNYIYGYNNKEYNIKPEEFTQFINENKVNCLIYSNKDLDCEKKTNLLELHPLIGFSEKEIIKLKEKYNLK